MVGKNKNSKTSTQYPDQQSRPSFRSPAIQAFLIQCAGFPATLFLVGVISFLTGQQIGIVAVALLQGLVAALITRWRRLAYWWSAIQLSFPCALVAVHSLGLPPWIFLAAFLFLLSIFWNTFHTQVPFYPSNQRVWDAVLRLLPHETSFRLVDIGSGMGGGVLYMAARRPRSIFVGIEVAPLPWLISVIKGWLTRSKARFIRGDYVNLDFNDYEVVFAYLSPAAMPALWEKAQKEMCRGSLLLSYEFPIPDVPANAVLHPEGDDIALYAWYIG